MRPSSQPKVARLGNGITHVPEAPVLDPLAAVLKDPQVPENRRFCGRCQAEVGRSRNGQPGRTSGYCPNCGAHYAFDPQLRPGDRVAGQYEVVGCLAHGGLGWIYLAIDRQVSDRWVVLKGLLNTEDVDAMEAAAAEQRFLAQVSHPNIVKIFNFTRHAGAGYIVMEYIGGLSLKAAITPKDPDGTRRYQPLPVDHALAFAVEVLGALGYLHDLGLLYCDLKPDNIIHVGDEVRLIDLGAVRRLDDDESAIFGTTGYQAPEVAELGTSVASDLYTVGRTLLALTCHVRGFSSTLRTRLPAQTAAPALAASDSFYRLLVKACAPNPLDRFVSADEMRAQAIGVQREVASRGPGGAAPLRPATQASPSLYFAPPAGVSAQGGWSQLPVPLPDRSDAGAAFLATVGDRDLGARLEQLRHGPAGSVDVPLELARTAMLLGDFEQVDRVLDRVLANDAWEWRAVWWQSVSGLVRGDLASARTGFNSVYGELPGELAPKLALAYACELSGEFVLAEDLYETCARTDAGYLPAAAFGLARLREARGEVEGARQALDLVPVSSSARLPAREATGALLVRSARGLSDLSAGVSAAESAQLSAPDLAQLRVAALRKGLALVGGGAGQAQVKIAGFAGDERGMRLGLESALRDLARLTPDPHGRYALVDEANAVRPWTTT